VRLWSLPTVVLGGHAGRVATPTFSGDGAIMATGSADGTLQVWDTRAPSAPRPLGRIALDPINGVALSPDGRTVATIDEKASSVKLFDITDPNAVTLLADLRPEATRYTYELAFSPDARHLLTGGDDHSIQIWDLADRTHPVPLGRPVPVSDGFVSDAKFSPDGRLLAVAAGGRGTLWNVADPTRPNRIGPDLTGPTNAVRRVAFSADHRTLVTAGDDAVRIWDIAHPNAVRQVGSPLLGHTSAIDSIAISRDGRTVASGGEDSSVQLWDITDTGHPTALGASIALPSTPTWNVAFDPAGGYLAGAGEGGVLRMWDLNVQHAISRICAVSGAFMTPRIWQEHLPRLPYAPPC
jgi:WD40 repeat protein